METLLTTFKKYLLSLHLGPVSRKLYLSDARRFLSFLPTPTLSLISSPSSYLKYLDNLRLQATSPSMIRRITASLHQFGAFVALTYGVPNPTLTIDHRPSTIDHITLFTNYLNSIPLSPLTIKSYKSDVSRYLAWTAKQKPGTEFIEVLKDQNIQIYLNHLTHSESAIPSTIERKSQSLTRFQTWYHNVYSPNTLPDNIDLSPPSLIADFSPSVDPLIPSSSTPSPDISQFFVKNFNYRSFITLAVLLLFTSTLAIFGYRQFVRDATPTQAVFPDTPTIPNRQLSFQGRLENSSGTPIEDPTDIVFKLYDAEGTGTPPSGGTELYSSGTCSIDPDPDGVFNTQIGSTCGSAITSTVFTENQDVWLQVTVGTSPAEVLSPRQQIATVAYALNTETIQGFPISSTISAVRNTIVPMNQFGEIIVGEQSPRLTGVAGTFQISAPALSFVTTTGTNGNITLAPDGTGQVNLTGNTTSTNFFNVSNAQLTTGSLITGTAANNNTGFKLIDLLSGSSPTSKFSVTDAGLTTIGADLYLNSGLSTFGTAVSDDTLEATKFCTGDGETNCATDFSTFATGTNYWTRSSGNISSLTLNDTISATTSAAVALTLTQTGAFDAFLVQDAAGDTTPFVIDQSGSVGIGTTTPTGKLHVEGACITGDTLIKRRRKKKKHGEDDEEEWEEVPITDIVPGDEIMSLDEQTGQFVISKVRQKMNMGIQETYLLVTESGKQIRTTAKHPYLTLTKKSALADFGGPTKVGSNLARHLLQTSSQNRDLSSFPGSLLKWAHTTNSVTNKSEELNPYLTLNTKKSAFADNLVNLTGLLTDWLDNLEKTISHPKQFVNSLNLGVDSPRVELGRFGLSSQSSKPAEPTPNLLSQKQISNATWRKVSELKPGMQIATVDGFETIISLQKFAREQVYDLEIDITHNFIGNDIVAHNTTGKALAIFNETGDQNILTASQSGIPVFNLARVAGTAANGTTFTPSATGNAVTQAATGSDTNIAYSLDAKGSGALNLNGTATGDILLGGGSGSTGCTLTNSTGNFSCTILTASALKWNSLTDPDGSLTLAHGVNPTTFGWTPTAALDAMTYNIVNNGGSATTQNGLIINNALAGSFTDVSTESLLLLQQLDTTTAGTTVLANALKIDSAANSSITNGINITNSAGNITTGLNIADTAGGTLDTGIGFSGTFTSEISLSNAETIDNLVNGTVNLGTTILKLTGGTSMVTDQTTFDLFNTTTTTLNIAGATTTLNLGAGGALTRTINLGTGTGADTINIGTGDTTADDINIGGLSTSHTDFTGIVNFAGGTSYYVDASGNAKFLDLQVADTGNPGLTVGNGSIGFVKIGGSTISDNAGNLTFDSDSDLLSTPDSASISGTLTIGNGQTIRPAYGPLSLAYKTGADTWATGLTLQDTTGNVGIGIASPSSTLNIARTTAPSTYTKANEYLHLGGTESASTTLRTIGFGWSETWVNYSPAYMGYFTTDNSQYEKGALIFGTRDVTTDTQATERMRIDTAGNVGIGNTAPSGRFVVSPPATETVTEGMTITADGCGTAKRITSAGVVTTNTTNTFSAPSAGNTGCIMTIINVGSNQINLDANTNFKTYYGTNLALSQYDVVPVISDGTYWYQTTAQVAPNADIAEWYLFNGEKPQPGEIVSIASDYSKIEKSNTPYDQRLSGIITTKPGIILGEKTDDAVAMALTGRVPAKVTISNNQIKSGDSITSSVLPGVGMKAAQAGQIVGKALEPTNWNEQACPAVASLDSIVWPEDDGTNSAKPCFRLPDNTYVGKIMAFVNVSWSDPDVYLTDTNDFQITSTVNQGFVLKIKNEIVNRIGAFSQLVVGTLTAGLIRTTDLQVATISPLSPDQPLTVTGPVIITNPEPSTLSHEPLLTVDGTLDVATLSARTAILDSLEVKNIIADHISANSIEGLDAKIASLSASTTTTLSDSDLETITNRIKARLTIFTDSPPTAEDLPTPSESTHSANLVNDDLVATSSAILDADFVTINEYLAVIGSATITSLDITSDLFTDSLSSKNNLLSLQPLGGVINLANGTLIVDSSGQVAINGDLTVSGKVLADSAEFSTLSLGNPSSATSSALGQLLAIYNERGEAVATIDASGSANLADLTTRLITIATGNDATPSSLLSSVISTNATAGNAVLLSPNTQLTINSPFVTPNSLVYLTPTGFTDNRVLFVQSKDSQSFTVAIDSPASSDIPFNWWIIQLEVPASPLNP